MDGIRYCCPCLFGVESVLSFEIKRIGGENLAVSDGRISFDGDISMLARANLRLSTAERVMIELGSFEAKTFEQLFQGVKSLPFENFIGKYDRFPVKGSSLNSQLHSIPDCQSIIKKAAVTRLSRKYGIEHFEETGSLHQIQFNLYKDRCTIYLDTSGIGLHKRGYRKDSNDAPIKETLAAAIADFARVKTGSRVVDPMCGSGTLLIESAYKSMRIAPGLNRHFSAESWKSVPKGIWKEERDLAREQANLTGGFTATGSDIDERAIALTLQNSRLAGVGDYIQAAEADIKSFKPEPGTTIVCNPPYGERLLDLKEAEELYKVMGQVLAPSKDHPCYIISPHEEFERLFGKKADKRRKLYNGMIRCWLYQYYI